MRIHRRYRKHAQKLANLQRPPGLRELVADGLIGSKSRVFIGRILGARWQSINGNAERLVAAFYQKLAAGDLDEDGMCYEQYAGETPGY